MWRTKGDDDPWSGPSGQTEDVKSENVKAMVDAAKEHGLQ